MRKLSEPHQSVNSSVAPQGERSEPLDSKREHLTDSFPVPAFSPASRGWGEDLPGWFRPSVPGWVASEDGNMVLKVQRFRSGGYEVTARRIDLPGLARMTDAPRRRGKREVPDTVDAEHHRKSAFRAKRKLRHTVKSMGADRLMTFTRREGPATKDWTPTHWLDWHAGGRDAWEAEHGAFWSFDDWRAAWDRFRRLCAKAGIDLCYVAVVERHSKGNLHLHAAITGWVNIKLARKLWLICCGGGRGSGNVDVRYIPFRGSRLDRSARIAKYVSKYITKGFDAEEDARFNKKRYWASRHDLPQVQRLILDTRDTGEALQALAQQFGLDPMAMQAADPGRRPDNYFEFADGSGFWYAFDDHHAIPPPF